ncbi:POK10 protein, partial [Ibidorhyncha struthersii]|nr:POK10 protein [Ibidorhyncha struthersii]
LSEGNQRAYILVVPLWAAPSVDRFTQAKQSHECFHQSAKVLQRQFGLIDADSRGIISTSADCQQFSGGLANGVNPRGTGPLKIWQMDVTHVPECGGQKFVHVCVDCFSLAVWATAQ